MEVRGWNAHHRSPIVGDGAPVHFYRGSLVTSRYQDTVLSSLSRAGRGVGGCNEICDAKSY